MAYDSYYSGGEAEIIDWAEDLEEIEQPLQEQEYALPSFGQETHSYQSYLGTQFAEEIGGSKRVEKLLIASRTPEEKFSVLLSNVAIQLNITHAEVDSIINNIVPHLPDIGYKNPLCVLFAARLIGLPKKDTREKMDEYIALASAIQGVGKLTKFDLVRYIRLLHRVVPHFKAKK